MHQKEKEKLTHKHNVVCLTNITTQYSYTLRILPFPAMISLLVYLTFWSSHMLFYVLATLKHFFWGFLLGLCLLFILS